MRFLRDKATKALVNLFTPRIKVLNKVIHQFINIDDPYVLERLCAVAYGCAMRSIDNEAIEELAKDVYEWIFNAETPYPHILLRDYARGIIELALHRGRKLNIEVNKIRQDIPVLVCTGYSEMLSTEHYDNAYIRDIIMKPIRVNVLAKKIRSILDG